MKTNIPFFRKFIHSIARPNQYAVMVKEGMGRAILYLLLLALTLGVIYGAVQSIKAAVSYTTFIDLMNEELPYFSLNNGELTVEGDEPIIFKDDSIGETVVIDDTGTYTRENVGTLLGNNTSVFLITKDYILTVDPTGTQEISFADFGDWYLDKEMVVTFLPYLKWFTALIGIFIVIWFFVSKLLMGFFYALLGLIASKIVKKAYTYGQLYSMGLYAITVPTIVDIMMNMLGFNFPWILYLILTMIYYVLALRATPNESDAEILTPIEEER